MMELIEETQLLPCTDAAGFVLVIAVRDDLDTWEHDEQSAAREILAEGNIALCPYAMAKQYGYEGLAARIQANWLTRALARRATEIRVYGDTHSRVDSAVLDVIGQSYELGGRVVICEQHSRGVA